MSICDLLQQTSSLCMLQASIYFSFNHFQNQYLQGSPHWPEEDRGHVESLWDSLVESHHAEKTWRMRHGVVAEPIWEKSDASWWQNKDLGMLERPWWILSPVQVQSRSHWVIATEDQKTTQSHKEFRGIVNCSLKSVSLEVVCYTVVGSWYRRLLNSSALKEQQRAFVGKDQKMRLELREENLYYHIKKFGLYLLSSGDL